MNKEIEKVIKKLQNMNFVTGLRECSSNKLNNNKHLIIDITKSLITETQSIDNLFNLLRSQSYFEWTVEMTN